MKKTPLQTPSPHTGNLTITNEVGHQSNSLSQFLMATLTMSWQLAIVVIVPIVGGYELDKKLHTSSLLTIVGFALAMAGTSLVIWRQYKAISSLPVSSDRESKS